MRGGWAAPFFSVTRSDSPPTRPRKYSGAASKKGVMMLESITVRCDWPGCGARLTTAPYAGCLRDFHWRCLGWGDESRGPHLCPGHRFKTSAEWEAARSEPTEAKGEGR
jgi:hypothetical protein